jgi:hypothetical protein
MMVIHEWNAVFEAQNANTKTTSFYHVALYHAHTDQTQKVCHKIGII